MIKRIIFDLDNTLMLWKDEYIFALKNVLDELKVKYDQKELLKFDSAVVDYENHHYIYNKKDFVEFVNNYCDSNLPIDFVDKLIIEQGKCFEYDNRLVDTIEYLSKKYDLIILSNWFTNTQKLRLKGACLLKYFTIVSGGDERPLKPNLEAFSEAVKGFNMSECLMVGDSLKNDIKPALELGMSAIWVTKEKDSNYKTIESIYELKNIL